MQLWIIPILPLIGFLINGILGRRFSKGLVSAIGVGSVALSFAWVLKTVLGLHEPITEHYFTWIESGIVNIGVDFAVDQLTAIMLLVVTGIGSLIHLYSIGYMAHEGGYHRFFAYLNLFMFFMLVLVLAGNYALLFVGWEGVGLCSYLLIGFYFDKKFATDAGNKAFIVNRIGDFGFALAMFLIVKNFGSLDFAKVFAQAPGAPEGLLTTIGLLLLVGACGKSAQIPLYVWLPDAMAGPTPVSALIHAATMVTAGVYMTARSAAIYTHAPEAMHIIAIVGIATAFFAASIGLVQNDIKKVFAYSTVSQLGYMFVAVGSGAFSAGIYHVVTHAFFKALLFLGAGSVIHALSGEQDMRHMGGLRQYTKWTFATMMCAAVAIAGVPPFAGFYSKDAILLAAHHHTPWIYWVGVVTAGMTAFYVFRAMFLTFFGAYRGTLVAAAGHGAAGDHGGHASAHTSHDDHGHGHGAPHESPMVMLLPLMVLAVLSLAGGWLFPIPTILEHLFPHAEEAHDLTLVAISVAAGVIGILIAWVMYVAKPAAAESPGGVLHKLLYNKYYVDEIYNAVIVKPMVAISRAVLWKSVDAGVIDGTVNGVGGFAQGMGSVLRLLQSGNVRSYAVWVLFGSVGVILALGIAGGIR